jgi:predicted esterase
MADFDHDHTGQAQEERRLVYAALAVVFILWACAAPSLKQALAGSLSTKSAPQSIQQPVQKGVVIQHLDCSLDPGQSYALYVPTGYTDTRSWPILYCFDPGAQGVAPVQAFKDGAEQFGYIVAGSNNSRNGPIAVSTAAINAIWRDTHARFNINDNRIYAAGFSGGARVACQFGYALPGKVAGVIACGAGFPTNIAPSRSTPFVVFATVGTADFNYPEMVRLARALDSASIPNRLRIFDGPHQWAPKDLAAEAIEWMQLQAMKSERLEKNNSFIDAMFAKEAAAARAYESSAKPYDAFLAYEDLVKDFNGIKDVAVFTTRVADLKNSKEIKQQLRQEKEEIDKQMARERELQLLKSRALDRAATAPGNSASDAGINNSTEASQDRAAALADLKRTIASLRKKSEESSPDRNVLRRVLQGFFVECYETASSLMQAKNYALAAANLEVAAEIRPDGRGVFFDLACAYSRLKDKNKALAALKKAVDNGYADLHSLESEADLELIRTEPEFQRILASFKSKAQ